MNRIYFTFLVSFILLYFGVDAQPWVQNDAIFNPSGVPSLPFSQPRFADLDGDGDFDMIIGTTNENPFYMENIGTVGSPAFIAGEDIFFNVDALDAEMGVCYDIDNDADLDFITGGFTGLNLFLNTGDFENPVFEKQEGFFSALSVGQNPIPDLADLDNDGDADLVVGFSEGGQVKVYTNEGTATTAIFSESNTYEVGDVGLYAYPTFCDLDDDGDQDLLVGRDTYGFIYYKNTGDPSAAVWEADPGVFEGLGNDTYWNSPDLIDLNGDDKFDLLFGTASGPLKYFINTGTTTSPSWQENTSLFGGVLDVGGASNPVFYDYDSDGDLDLFTGTQLGDIKYFENTGSSSGPAWEENSSYFTSLKHSIYSAVAIGDVNDDGLPDAIVGDLSGSLYYHRNTGDGFVLESSYLQSVSLGGWSAPRLIDMDDDGDLDIVAGNENGNLIYLSNEGSDQEPDWQEISGFFGSIDVGMNCVPTLGDVDFDGDPDLLCGNISGELKYYENNDGNWTMNTEIFQGITGDQNTTPALADLDGDGDVDLTLGQYSGIFNYFENQNPTTGVKENPASVFTQINSWPNPCKNILHVEFDLAVSGNVNITVMGLQGETILNFDKQAQQPGNYTENFNMADLPAGVYLLRFKTNKTSKILRIIKM